MSGPFEMVECFDRFESQVLGHWGLIRLNHQHESHADRVRFSHESELAIALD